MYMVCVFILLQKCWHDGMIVSTLQANMQHDLFVKSSKITPRGSGRPCKWHLGIMIFFSMSNEHNKDTVPTFCLSLSCSPTSAPCLRKKSILALIFSQVKNNNSPIVMDGPFWNISFACMIQCICKKDLQQSALAAFLPSHSISLCQFSFRILAARILCQHQFPQLHTSDRTEVVPGKYTFSKYLLITSTSCHTFLILPRLHKTVIVVGPGHANLSTSTSATKQNHWNKKSHSVNQEKSFKKIACSDPRHSWLVSVSNRETQGMNQREPRRFCRRRTPTCLALLEVRG